MISIAPSHRFLILGTSWSNFWRLSGICHRNLRIICWRRTKKIASNQFSKGGNRPCIDEWIDAGVYRPENSWYSSKHYLEERIKEGFINYYTMRNSSLYMCIKPHSYNLTYKLSHKTYYLHSCYVPIGTPFYGNYIEIMAPDKIRNKAN